MRRVLVWGGTGFIGRQLVAALADVCESVTVITRNTAAADRWARRLGIGLIELSPARDPGRTRMAVGDCDTVFDLAGCPAAVASNINREESIRDGVIEQLAFLEACAAASHRPHVIFASSRLVYGQPESVPVMESSPLFPRSLYAANKIYIEQYLQVLALRDKITFTIARISNPYGHDPGCASRGHGFINQIALRASRGDAVEIFGDGAQLRDYIHILDLVDFLCGCGRSPAARNQIFNAGSGRGISIRAAAESICAIAPAPIVFRPWPPEQYLVESGDYVADIGKARRLLGFSPNRSFDEEIRAIVEMIRADRLPGVVPAAAG